MENLLQKIQFIEAAGLMTMLGESYNRDRILELNRIESLDEEVDSTTVYTRLNNIHSVEFPTPTNEQKLLQFIKHWATSYTEHLNQMMMFWKEDETYRVQNLSNQDLLNKITFFSIDFGEMEHFTYELAYDEFTKRINQLTPGFFEQEAVKDKVVTKFSYPYAKDLFNCHKREIMIMYNDMIDEPVDDLNYNQYHNAIETIITNYKDTRKNKTEPNWVYLGEVREIIKSMVKEKLQWRIELLEANETMISDIAKFMADIFETYEMYKEVSSYRARPFKTLIEILDIGYVPYIYPGELGELKFEAYLRGDYRKL